MVLLITAYCTLWKFPYIRQYRPGWIVNRGPSLTPIPNFQLVPVMRNISGYLILLLFGFTLTTCDKSSILDTYPFPEGEIFFTSAPIDVQGVKWFIGMGEPNVLPKDHGGFVLKNPYVLPAGVPVLAVADGVVIMASHGTRAIPSIPDAPQALWGTEYEDHLLELKVSKNVTVNYAHVSAFHPAIAAQIGDLPKDEVGHHVEVVVKAGDTLGFVGPHAAMDFSATDRSLNLNFLNPSRYPGDHIYSADVLSYFREPVLSQLLSITLRQEPPRGGKVDYDVAGRIAGNWFLEGTTNYVQWSRQLAIVYHHIYSDRITIADGSPMRDVPGNENPGRPDIYWVKGNTPLPETIDVGDGMVKYRLIPVHDPNDPNPYIEEQQPVVGEMLVHMINEGSMRIEFFKGTSAPATFTSQAKVYVR